MTYTDKDLDNVLDISHLKIKVGHLNGTEAFISKIGNLMLANGLTLYDVMAILEYCVTLISVHKMAKENKIFVVFDESKCYFMNQDLNLKNILGTSDQCEGLYYYNEQGTMVNKNNLSFQCLLSQYNWHCRLGHPEPVMNILKKSLNFDKPDKDLCCEVYQRAKQTREPFSSSDHVSSSLEELVYLDLWGPYRSASSSSSESGGMSFTADFLVNSGNDADSSEMNALLRNGTWDIVELPTGRKAIGSKWIYKIKYESSGEIDRFKARLLAQGFGQKEGIDYEESFSPVVKMVTVKCLLNIVVSQSWPVFYDVNNAFLYGDLDEVFLKSKFMIKDLGKLKYFFGIEVVDTEKGICLNQRKYVLDLLSEYGMLACKHVDTTLLSKLIISNEATKSDPVLENITDYQKLTGKLIYLTNTRPDISYVVHCLSQLMNSPLKSHLKTAFRILRYLKGCPGLGIHFVNTSENILKGVVRTVKCVWLILRSCSGHRFNYIQACSSRSDEALVYHKDMSGDPGRAYMSRSSLGSHHIYWVHIGFDRVVGFCSCMERMDAPSALSDDDELKVKELTRLIEEKILQVESGGQETVFLRALGIVTLHSRQSHVACLPCHMASTGATMIPLA
nr:ribonuclease H-like domain-containing protein [Tanacetum cinerariifolium]